MAGSDRYRAYVKREQRRLEGLPYFAESEERQRAFLVMFDALDQREGEDAALEAILRWEVNRCSDPLYRVLALDYLRHRTADEVSSGGDAWPATKLERSSVVRGDLHVQGNLINAVGLTVLGDLRIDGAYVAQGEYPCLHVAGTIHARDLFGVETETIALGGVRVEGTVWVAYNHTITIAPFVEAHTVCAADAEISAEVRAERRFVDDIPVRALFGFEGDDVDTRVAEWMLRRGDA
ncbi:hypothetical protein [Paraliomyxa miuraensis]|uniref:hypothetical protein n=1 Tax=Paraliomyxa miuraensis TaxID=376150 RepID=UPI002254AB2E|nr:hypothetical protein [Paraliomyxa miuraensis]MCX4240708.1 hypothetical protein [Paraliomyxa miuraensis]